MFGRKGASPIGLLTYVIVAVVAVIVINAFTAQAVATKQINSGSLTHILLQYVPIGLVVGALVYAFYSGMGTK